MKKGIKALLMGGILAGGAGYGLYKWFSKEKNEKKEEEEIVDSIRYRRLECYYDMLSKWMELRLNHSSIAAYLKKQGIRKVAIYGHGKIGILLYQDLIEDGMKAEYFVDGQLQPDYRSIDDTLVTIPERLSSAPETDAMIVTPSYDFDEIEKYCKKNGYKGTILSFSHLLYQV